MRIIQAKHYADMSRKAASILSAQIILKENAVLGLATGSTPIGAYQQLAEWNQKGDLDFSQVRTVNLDEYRGLPSSHPQSYRRFMDEHLFSQINIDPANTHVPAGNSGDAAAECAAYDALISQLGGIDLQLLGIGHNGHIGFNEPAEHFVMQTHEVALSDSTLKANSRFFDNPAEQPRSALTMGIGSIMGARRVLLIAGKEKRDILDRALHGPVTPQIPASILQLHPNLTVIFSENE